MEQAWRRGRRLVTRGLLWLVTGLATMVMFDAGLGKFTDAPGWQHWFVTVWGYPTWFRGFIGLAETGGALLLLVPLLASFSATGLIIIMLGALWTVTTKETDLSSVDPIVNIVLLSVVLVGWWPRRWRRAAR